MHNHELNVPISARRLSRVRLRARGGIQQNLVLSLRGGFELVRPSGSAEEFMAGFTRRARELQSVSYVHTCADDDGKAWIRLSR